MRTHIPRFAASVLAVSAMFASVAVSAEMPPPDVSPKPSDSVKVSVPRVLSDAQIEALMKEIGLRYDGAAEAAPTREAKTPLPQAASAPPDAQEQALLREMRHWYDSRTATTAAAAPKPEVKPPPPAQRTWQHHWRRYAGRAEADRGEAARLMREELQQRGVAVETAAGSGEPK